MSSNANDGSDTVVHSKGEAIVISNPFSDGSSGLPSKIVALEELKPLRSVDEFLTIAIEGEHQASELLDSEDDVHLFYLFFFTQLRKH